MLKYMGRTTIIWKKVRETDEIIWCFLLELLLFLLISFGNVKYSAFITWTSTEYWIIMTCEMMV